MSAVGEGIVDALRVVIDRVTDLEAKLKSEKLDRENDRCIHKRDLENARTHWLHEVLESKAYAKGLEERMPQALRDAAAAGGRSALTAAFRLLSPTSMYVGHEVQDRIIALRDGLCRGATPEVSDFMQQWDDVLSGFNSVQRAVVETMVREALGAKHHA